MRQRLDLRRNIDTAALFVASSASELLKLVDADFALLSIEGESRGLGRLDPYSEAMAIMAYFQTCRFSEIKSSVNVTKDFPNIVYAPGITTIAGVLIVPLHIGGTNDLMVFFRRSQLREVKWAGYVKENTLFPIGLGPRSF